MRYRVKSYSAAVTAVGSTPEPNTLTISFGVSQSVYDNLPNVVNNNTAPLEKAITEAIRLIADETQGGYVLCSTGQKGVISSATKTSSTSGSTTTYSVSIVFTKALLSGAAAVDTDDTAAIAAIFATVTTLTDQFTIEMDFGEAPEEKVGKLTTALENIVSGFTIQRMENPPDQQHSYYELVIDDTVKIENGTLIIG